ncbi:hypothetical protein Droror1_Dr00009206 [Drosera rotundifolia]
MCHRPERLIGETMAKRTAFLVMWITVALVTVETNVWWCMASDAAKTFNAASEAVQEKAEDFKDSTAEIAGSWKHWAINKINEAWKSKSEDGAELAQDIADKASDAGSKSAETMHSAASGAAQYASDKASEAANLASEHAGDAKDYLHNKANTGANIASDAKDSVQDAFNHGGDKAREMLDQGVDKLSDLNGDEVAKHAKTGFEAAKDKVTQAADKAKASIGKDSSEL